MGAECAQDVPDVVANRLLAQVEHRGDLLWRAALDPVRPGGGDRGLARARHHPQIGRAQACPRRSSLALISCCRRSGAYGRNCRRRRRNSRCAAAPRSRRHSVPRSPQASEVLPMTNGAVFGWPSGATIAPIRLPFIYRRWVEPSNVPARCVQVFIGRSTPASAEINSFPFLFAGFTGLAERPNMFFKRSRNPISTTIPRAPRSSAVR